MSSSADKQRLYRARKAGKEGVKLDVATLSGPEQGAYGEGLLEWHAARVPHHVRKAIPKK